MAPQILVKHGVRPLYICDRCLLKKGFPSNPRRHISQRFLQRTIEAEEQWKAQERLIVAGKQQDMLQILEDRGYVKSIVGGKGRDDLNKLMRKKRIGVYVGVDPTAPSIHVGNLLPLMPLFWMYLHGFHTVSLLGGATAQLGDPSGRTSERTPQASAERKVNIASMHLQLKKIWKNLERVGAKFGYTREWAWRRELVNNNTWLNKVSVIEILKVVGPGIRLGAMLGRDTVKTRMDNGSGMSFAEFSYPVLQAWDWWHMYHTKAVQVQIGGSDQFGNILAGIEALNHIRRTHYDPDLRQVKDHPLMVPYGFTVPLLTTPSGEKFGKSAGNAIWLSQQMTSSFDLYKFFIRTPDSEVERYLKLFTFIPLSEIQQIMETHEEDRSKRVAQHRLAREFVDLVHGEKDAIDAEEQHRTLYAKGGSAIDLSALKTEPEKTTWGPLTKETASFQNPSLNKYAPQVNASNTPHPSSFLPRSLVVGQPFSRILYYAGLASSKSEGHRLVNNQAAHVGSAPGPNVGNMGDELRYTNIKSFDPSMPEKYLIEDEILILKVGKWNVRIIRVLPDDEFDSRELDCPGWKDMKLLLKEKESKVGELDSQENR